MKSLGFQMRLEKLKPEVLRDERLENKNTLISRGKIVFWTCLQRQRNFEHLWQRRRERQKKQFSGFIIALTTQLCDYLFIIPPKFCLSESYHLFQQGLGYY